MDPITLMLLIGGLTTLAGIGTSTASNIINTNAQKAANQQNISLQKEVNAQNQYNFEHAHQIEMADLEAAGLNPVMTAMGGSGAQVSNLQAPQTKPVQTDLSGVQSALAGVQSMMSTMMMFQIMSQRNDLFGAKNDILSSNNARTTEAYKDRTVLWKRAGSNYTNSAQTVNNLSKRASKSLSDESKFAQHFTGIKDPKKAMQELLRIAKISWLKH